VERHLTTVNTLFSDGHVKAMKLDALIRKNPAGVMPLFSIEED
jgi:prepilin-type processing-associated H-X9-DG protein